MKNSLKHEVCPNCKSYDWEVNDPEEPKLICKCNVCGRTWSDEE